MKLSLIVILIVAVIPSWGQAPRKGDHIKDDNLDPFVGTWVAAQGDESLTIVLTKADVFIKGLGYTQQLLIGWHEFKKADVIVESSLKYAGSYYDKNTTILGSSDGPGSVKLTTFRDLSKSRIHNGILVLEGLNVLKLKISLAEQVSINKSNQARMNSVGFKIPSDWSLTKTP